MEYWIDITKNPTNINVGRPKIGKNTWVGHFTVLDASGGLEIGENCSIASGVHIYTHDSVKGRFKQERESVKIGNNVFIGANTVVLKGVTIGDNVTIGALSLVNKDIPSNTKAYGNPIKLKKK